MADALWQLIATDGGAARLADMLIFLPSRRAVRGVEKMLATRMGGACVLPRLVPLGTGDDMDDPDNTDTLANTERVVVLARLLAADAHIGTMAGALPIARDLVRMTDYLENEGIDIATIDWDKIIGEKYARHFQAKGQLLKILGDFCAAYNAGHQTQTQQRNAAIRGWIGNMHQYARVIVCASTASVPATADLMAHIAQLPQGMILFPGKIVDSDVRDLALATNPYYAEYCLLQRLGQSPADVMPIDVGASPIDFFNAAFANRGTPTGTPPTCRLITPTREADEAAAAAEIAARATAQNKSVLIITPDAAGNQRLAAALAARQIPADFSGGTPGTQCAPGRAILNLFDKWIDTDAAAFDRAMGAANNDLFRMLVNLIDTTPDLFHPAFAADDPAYMDVWVALQDLSRYITDNQIAISLRDARALVADTLGTVSLRGAMAADAPVVVLGTIESRMQTADVVILTGLNEGMFPARGYENAWLPPAVAAAVGLPPADRKVSLMALDFMTLSCGENVYWLRSRISGGTQTTESRFLSRVAVAMRHDIPGDADLAQAVDARDACTPNPLRIVPPTPPADRSDIYVTELELLIHNPYAFYAKHILRLRPRDDYWVGPDARTFGNLVHDVIERATDWRATTLVAEMDCRAAAAVGANSVLYHFWHRRFAEIAPLIAETFGGDAGHAEIPGSIQIAGRTVRARADRVWDGCVLDIKTGAAPSKKQLMDGNMPQLPLEAAMLQSGGFAIPTTGKSRTPIMRFLQLRNRDTKLIEYGADDTAAMMTAARGKVSTLFGQYNHPGAPYEYRETNEVKYHAYDDLARLKD